MSKNLRAGLGLAGLGILFFLPLKAVKADDAAPQLPTGYVLDQVKGTVLIIPKGESKSVTAQDDQTVQTGDEVITSKDSEASLTFNGAAMIQLSAGSDLKVGDLTQPSNKGFLSRLKLLAGQVMAQVQKMGSSHSVFEIEAGGVVCGVRGTAFEVQKNGASVDTDTYEGVVEMDKGGQSQKVAAGRHSEFDTDQGLFRLQRLLNDREKARYENWQKYRNLVTQRQKEREAALKAFNSLPKNDKAELWQKLQQAGDRDRFRILRTMMREKNQKDRLQVIDHALQARTNNLNEINGTEKKAQEAREQELKRLKKKKKSE